MNTNTRNTQKRKTSTHVEKGRNLAKEIFGDRNEGAIGLGVHILKDGVMNLQGTIIREDRPFFLVQLYSCLDGSPTYVIPVRVDVIYSDKVRLFADKDAMDRAFNRAMDEIERRERKNPKDQSIDTPAVAERL